MTLPMKIVTAVAPNGMPAIVPICRPFASFGESVWWKRPRLPAGKLDDSRVDHAKQPVYLRSNYYWITNSSVLSSKQGDAP